MTDGGKQPELKNSRGILCAKCEHVNRLGDTNCGICGAHLYINCHACGTQNQRVNIRCSECKRSMHRSIFDADGKSKSFKKTRYKAWQFILLMIVVYVVYKIIVILSEYPDSSLIRGMNQ
jgi:hypothetical protein